MAYRYLPENQSDEYMIVARVPKSPRQYQKTAEFREKTSIITDVVINNEPGDSEETKTFQVNGNTLVKMFKVRKQATTDGHPEEVWVDMI